MVIVGRFASVPRPCARFGCVLGVMLVVMLAVPASAQRTTESKPSARAADNWMKRCRADQWQEYSTDFEGVRLHETDGGNVRFEGGPRAPCSDPTPPGSRVSLGATQIEFEGGGGAERWARVVEDPSSPKNHVLRFWLGAANVRNERGAAIKGRVQLNTYGNKAARDVEVTVRARLSGAFATLSNQGGTFEWLTVSEWWNNASWTRQDYPFRISVNIVKDEAGPGRPLRFAVHAQAIDKSRKRAGFSNVWAETQRSFSIPVGQWMTLRYHVVEGDASTGRFRMTVTPEGQKEVVLFDIRGATHHPDDPAPDGLSHINPIKIYTSGKLLGAVQSSGDGLTIDWDDLSIKLKDGS